MFNYSRSVSDAELNYPALPQPAPRSRHPMTFIATVIIAIMAALLLMACQTEIEQPQAELSVSLSATAPAAQIAATSTANVHLPMTIHTEVTVGMTNVQPDGNRVVAGSGNLPGSSPLDIPLNGAPAWVVAAPTETGALWVVTLNDGSVQAFELTDGIVRSTPITPTQLAPGMPPLLVVADGVARLVAPADASTLTSPARFGRDGLAFVNTVGKLVIEGEGGSAMLDVGALPDARILVDEQDRLLLLTAPTDRYGHGVLGDDLEAGAITLVETTPTPRVVQVIVIPAPRVIEGIAPIWADLDGDGVREIIVTLSDAEQGAQIVVFAEDGRQVAAGPAIGRGFRWRHQLAVAPFGPDGEPMLADVLTPHIGGVVEFYRWIGDELVIEAMQSGYTSHVIGTRNLDMAVAGDMDGDGRFELLLPDQARRQLGAVRYAADGAQVVWTLPVDGQIVTNVAAVTLDNSGVAVGVGRLDGVLRVWQP